MTLRISGIIEITGEHGTGKTTAALECGAHPSRIRIYDDDIKGRSTARELHEDGTPLDYVDATAMRASCKRDHEYYPKFKASLDAIKPGDFDVVVFDTWTAVQKACRAYVSKYPEQFKDQERGGGYFTGNSAMINGQISRIGRELEADLLNTLESKVKLIFLLAHLKDQYINNTQTGKQIPDDSSTLERVPSTRIWYRSNPHSSVPISLFIKRPSVKRYDETLGRIATVNIFPRKVTPQEGDTSVWDAYNRYFDNPFGNRKATQDETPSDYELSIIDGTLTADQKMIYKTGTAIAKLQEAETDETSDLLTRAMEMKASNTPFPEIAKALNIGLPELAKLLK